MIRSWMVIAGVTFAIALGANVIRPADVKWFRRLERPPWLTFEALIPVIWSIVFVCGGWSAYVVWEQNPGEPITWATMAGYIVLEVLIVAYTPATLWSRNLKLGTYIGGIGSVLGAVLAVWVMQFSAWASFLLLPYLIWSPIGAFTTWRMHQINS
ncbi:MAG: tryptophan-rich sensory protein [Cyanobacteria bacterium P01_G01_bin.38]